MKLLYIEHLSTRFIPTKFWHSNYRGLRALKCVSWKLTSYYNCKLRIAYPIRLKILYDVVIIQDYFHAKFGNLSFSRLKAFELEKFAEYQLRKFGFIKKA